MTEMTDIAPNESSPPELAARVSLAKTDRDALGSLVRDYTPFIHAELSTHLFDAQDREDLLTEAQLAFANAAQNYDEKKGAFIPYARSAVRNRILDALRQKKTHTERGEISLDAAKTADGEEKNAITKAETELALRSYERQQEEENLREEIGEATADFSAFGFDWVAVKKASPKAAKTRAMCLQAVQILSGDARLSAQVLQRHTLPATELLATGLFNKKLLERHRIYILALFLLKRGDYPYIGAFLPKHRERRL